MLDGMFSFVLLDTHDNSFLVARDAIGITSLYIGWGLDGMYYKNIFLYLKFDQLYCSIHVFIPCFYQAQSGFRLKWKL